MFVEDRGQGLPVLLLHGFPLDHRMWTYQTELLAQQYRVIVPDLPGMGRSGVPGELMSMERYADDVLALLDRLGVQRAVLGGFSMGGYLAFALLRKAPERFVGLLLANTRAEADAAAGRKGRMQMAAALYEHGAAAARDAMLPKLLAESTRRERPELAEELAGIMGGMPAEGLVQASLAMAFRREAVSLLGELTLPTLVVAGEHDAIAPPDEMRAMAERIRGAAFHVVAGAAHLAPLEQPEAFNRLLAPFVAGIAATVSSP
ncbi:alpha/beta fold hydrolase [Paenibacillus athensensis]|uniref:AB hydrolase-1 domain-containing protein n=2 Tax=Paenibacillus athensensis TaxID=1967502 RepID=A0A4Y8PXQ2_9BACL|nr:alpha/beta fold hydrolase [Paenibacillus athensensis]